MKRLSDKLVGLIQDQMKREEYSSRLFRAMGEYYRFKGWTGIGQLFHEYSKEELVHMKKFYKYLQDRNIQPVPFAIEAPPKDYGTVKEGIEYAYKFTVEITKFIEILSLNALAEKDLTTAKFLEWYLKDQIKEEAKYVDITGRIAMMEEAGISLYFLDKELGKEAKKM